MACTSGTEAGSGRDRAVRIGLIGGECTGKSTLAQELAQDLSQTLGARVLVVPERLRAFVAESGRAPHAHEQAQIMDRQRADEDEAARQAQIVIADPATLMTAVYSEMYFEDPGLWPKAASHAIDYGLLLWCRPDIPWTPDPGQRDGPRYRQQADEILARHLAPSQDFLLGDTQVHQVQGDPDQRRRLAVMHAMAALSATGVWREGEPGFRT